jgi:hypothetical protein
MTFEMARLTVLEMSRVFEVTPVINVDRLPRPDYAQLEVCLTEAGLAWYDPADAERQLASLRATYEPFLEVLARYLLLPLPGWLPGERRRDNCGTESTATVD